MKSVRLEVIARWILLGAAFLGSIYLSILAGALGVKSSGIVESPQLIFIVIAGSILAGGLFSGYMCAALSSRSAAIRSFGMVTAPTLSVFAITYLLCVTLK